MVTARFGLVKGDTDVRFGSLADMTALFGDVRFTPENGHAEDGLGCPLSAKSRHLTTKEMLNELLGNVPAQGGYLRSG